MKVLKQFGAAIAIFGVTIWQGFTYYVMNSVKEI